MPFASQNEVETEQMFKYEMWTSPDGWPYMTELNSGRAGFFFAVSGFPEEQVKMDHSLNCVLAVPRTLHVCFKNMSNQAKLLSYGHTPVCLEVSDENYQQLIAGKMPMYR